MTSDPALVLLDKLVNGADTDNTLWHQPEGPGLVLGLPLMVAGIIKSGYDLTLWTVFRCMRQLDTEE